MAGKQKPTEYNKVEIPLMEHHVSALVLDQLEDGDGIRSEPLIADEGDLEIRYGAPGELGRGASRLVRSRLVRGQRRIPIAGRKGEENGGQRGEGCPRDSCDYHTRSHRRLATTVMQTCDD